MIRRGAMVAWLLFVWVALTGSVSVANVIIGLVASMALLWFFRPAYETKIDGVFRPWRALCFLGYFVYRFLEANIQVALAVIRPERVRHKRAIISVPIAGVSWITTIILAYAVSLTPGTFILELRLDPPVMYVHILQLSTVRTARLEILDLERRIVHAFGPAGASDRVKELMACIAAETDV